MKRILLIAAALMLPIAVASSSLAQTRPGATAAKPAAPQTPPTSNTLADTRIALVDTTMFGDEKGGIIKYVNAVKAIAREFEPRQTELNNLQNRIQAISNEISTLSKAQNAASTIQAKKEEGERLQRE